MYICICNAIRECELRTAARRCPGNAQSVYASMGKVPDCCCCIDDAEAILEDEREFATCPA
ncbi:ferredoxin [Caenibius tardaugens NBRC 16725]|nr:ferredoxin [Caenibius tardaugens]AZI36709.1 ferredoxin [Caenibius tardaugens NBRC 16725]